MRNSRSKPDPRGTAAIDAWSVCCALRAELKSRADKLNRKYSHNFYQCLMRLLRLQSAASVHINTVNTDLASALLPRCCPLRVVASSSISIDQFASALCNRYAAHAYDPTGSLLAIEMAAWRCCRQNWSYGRIRARCCPSINAIVAYFFFYPQLLSHFTIDVRAKKTQVAN